MYALKCAINEKLRTELELIIDSLPYRPYMQHFILIYIQWLRISRTSRLTLPEVRTPQNPTIVMNNCVFCEIAKQDPPNEIRLGHVFLSTELVLGFLDIQPLTTSVAHVLVVPRKHYATIDQMDADPESAAALGRGLTRVSKALQEVLGEHDFNVIQNNGASAGQVVDHVHFHIVVRPPPQADKVTQAVAKALLSPDSPSNNADFRFRLSYSSQVYGRGQRTDLDESWAVELTTKLRRALGSGVKL